MTKRDALGQPSRIPQGRRQMAPSSGKKINGATIRPSVRKHGFTIKKVLIMVDGYIIQCYNGGVRVTEPSPKMRRKDGAPHLSKIRIGEE